MTSRILVTKVALLTLYAISIPLVALGQTGDDLFLQVGHRVPEFAGLATDPQDGEVILYLTNSHQGVVEDVRSAIAEVFPPAYIEAHPFTNVRLVEVSFSFIQLKEWRDRLVSTVFRIEGVVSSTIDLQTNGIQIGVEDPEVQGPAVEAEVQRHGIPRAAVGIKAGQSFGSTSARPKGVASEVWLAGASVVGVVIVAALTLLRRRTSARIARASA